MTAWTGFDPDLARRQLREIWFNLVAPKLSTQNRPTILISAMKLKNGFGDIQSNNCYWLRHVLLLLLPICRFSMHQHWQVGREGASMPSCAAQTQEVFDRDGSEIAAEGLRRIAEIY